MSGSYAVSNKTRKSRRRATAEVFTPSTLVEGMLDHVPPEAWSPEKTFIDNSAGNGAFLTAIFRRKVEIHGHDPLEALSSLFGVELMEDNVRELKQRLFHMVVGYVGKDEPKLRSALRIIRRNIVCANALTYDYSFAEPP